MSLSVRIKKDLGDFKLDIAFEAENEVLGILGASGCGKSMTLQCIAGVVRPDEGRIVLDGVTLFDSEKRIDLPPQKRGVGLLFQNYSLFPNMTVLQNVLCSLSRVKNKEEKLRRAMEMLNRLGLEGLEKRKPHELSGGQQQRTALARILAGEPKVLMLDEPFSALDSYLQWQVEMELAELISAFRGTVLFVSHSRDEVYRLCDSICVIDKGKGEPVVPVKTLFSDPVTLDAALLSGCKNFSRARKTGRKTVLAEDWGVELQCREGMDDGCRYLGVRSHFVDPGCPTNRISCQVVRVVEDVFGSVVMLRPEGAAEDRGFSQLRMDTDKKTGLALTPGQRLEVGIKPEDILLLR